MSTSNSKVVFKGGLSAPRILFTTMFSFSFHLEVNYDKRMSDFMIENELDDLFMFIDTSDLKLTLFTLTDPKDRTVSLW